MQICQNSIFDSQSKQTKIARKKNILNISNGKHILELRIIMNESVDDAPNISRQ